MNILLTILAVALALPAFAADWTEYRMGPFHVFSDAGDRRAREALTELEQIRHVLGAQIGKADLTAVFPIHVVLFEHEKEYLNYVLPQPLIDGGSASLAAWAADISKNDALPPDLIRAITARLMEDNAGRMPHELETAIGDLFSTIRVQVTRVWLGAPPPASALPGDRRKHWAKVQMMVTQPLYSGKLGVYLNNLQQAGDEDTASWNAFGIRANELMSKAAAYLAAGRFEEAQVNGKGLNPNRDFIEKDVDSNVMQELFAELKSGGKDFPPQSPRGLLATNTMASLQLAIQANPRWAEPHARLATREQGLAVKIAHWKKATELDPRNTGYWRSLAEAQTQARLFADAEKSWTSAERWAPNTKVREELHQAKLKLQDQRAEADIEARRRAKEEEAAELQRIKDAAAAEVKAAERAANERLAENAGNIEGAIPFFGEPDGTRIEGSLTRVDCLAAGAMRLTIQQDTRDAIRLLIRNPKQLMVAADSGEVRFTCGPQRGSRQIEVIHDSNADAKTDTVGDILMVKFL